MLVGPDTGALLRALGESRIGAFECDHRLGLLHAGDVARAAFALPPSEQICLGRWQMPAAIVASLDPAGEPRFCFEQRVTETGGRPDGFLVQGVTLFEDSPGHRRATRSIGTVIDIAALKQLDRPAPDDREYFLEALKERLRAIADPVEVQYEASLALGQRLGVNRCGYAEDAGDGDSIIVTTHHVSGVPAIHGRHAYRQFGNTLFDDLNTGKPQVTANASADDRLTAEQKRTFRDVQVEAMVNVPLIRDGRLVAVMFVHDAHPRTWTDEEITLIEAVSARTWEAAERARAESRLGDAQRRLRGQQDRLQLFIEHAPAGIAMLDRQLNYLVASRRYAEDFGLTTHELIGRGHYDVFPDVPSRWREIHQRCLAGDVASHEADAFERADGSVIWLRWKVRPWRDDHDQVAGLLFFSEVITERVRAEERLRGNAETFYRLVADNPFGVYVIDAEFRVAVVSRGSLRVFENVQPVVGRDFAEVLRAIWAEPFATEAITRFRHTLDTGEPFVSTRIGEQRGDINAVETYDWRIERIVLPDGRFGVVCYFYDLSDRIRMETRLRESEARLEIATAAAGIGIYDYDVRSGAIVWDQRVREIWGIDLDEPVDYTTFAAGLHPDDAPATHAAVDRALDPSGPGRMAVEYRVIDRRSGITRWVAASGRVSFDENRRPLRLIGTAQDISERKAVENALQAFYEVSPLMMGTVELHPDGDIVPLYINPAMRRFFGLDAADPKGCSAREVGLPESTVALWRRSYEAARDADAPVSFEYEHQTRLGSATRTVAATVASLGRRVGSGGLAFCFIADDVTDLRQAQRDLSVAINSLEDADRRKDEFLATLSHELRNPLSPLQVAAGILTSPQAGAREQESAKAVIQRQVRHLGLLLDDLLDVARITRGSLELRRERATLASIVDTALETTQQAMKVKAHRLTVRLPDQPVWLDVDALRISQVLTNLLGNACKYTAPQGHIELAAGVDADGVRIQVRDNGIGIATEEQAHVFDMFTRSASAHRHGESGLGIGLALARALVELHGGSITASSDGEGKGSAFVVRLPHASSLPGPEAEGVDPQTLDAQAPVRVLIADDNRDAADMLASLMALKGHDVRIGYGGRSAIEIAESFEPQIALLDVGMPDIDGYEVARRLRAMPWANDLILVAITGWGGSEDRRRTAAAGFSHHLTKPVEPRHVIDLVASCGARH